MTGMSAARAVVPINVALAAIPIAAFLMAAPANKPKIMVMLA